MRFDRFFSSLAVVVVAAAYVIYPYTEQKPMFYSLTIKLENSLQHLIEFKIHTIHKGKCERKKKIEINDMSIPTMHIQNNSNNSNNDKVR